MESARPAASRTPLPRKTHTAISTGRCCCPVGRSRSPGWGPCRAGGSVPASRRRGPSGTDPRSGTAGSPHGPWVGRVPVEESGPGVHPRQPATRPDPASRPGPGCRNRLPLRPASAAVFPGRLARTVNHSRPSPSNHSFFRLGRHSLAATGGQGTYRNSLVHSSIWQRSRNASLPLSSADCSARKRRQASRSPPSGSRDNANR